MGFVKCPRCELNYMQDDEQYCSVCKREVKGESKDELFELCSVCSENPVYPGKDLCLFCLKEMGKSNETAMQDETSTAANNALELGSASTMDEIAMDMEADIPAREYGEISRELSLQEAIEIEKEESGDDDDDEEEEV